MNIDQAFEVIKNEVKFINDHPYTFLNSFVSDGLELLAVSITGEQGHIEFLYSTINNGHSTAIITLVEYKQWKSNFNLG